MCIRAAIRVVAARISSGGGPSRLKAGSGLLSVILQNSLISLVVTHCVKIIPSQCYSATVGNISCMYSWTSIISIHSGILFWAPPQDRPYHPALILLNLELFWQPRAYLKCWLHSEFDRSHQLLFANIGRRVWRDLVQLFPDLQIIVDKASLCISVADIEKARFVSEDLLCQPAFASFNCLDFSLFQSTSRGSPVLRSNPNPHILSTFWIWGAKFVLFALQHGLTPKKK